MIRIEGYDKDEMDRIDNELFEKYREQNEIDNYDEFVQKNAPPIFLEYCKKYRAARERLAKEGKIA